MKWMDVMMGEVSAKRDAAEARQARRDEVLGAARECFDNVVHPALEGFRAAHGEGEAALDLQSFQDADRDALVLRLTPPAGDDRPLPPYLEFAAEPYHPFVAVWLRAAVDNRPRRLEFYRVEELSGEAVRECLKAFEAALEVSPD